MKLQRALFLLTLLLIPILTGNCVAGSVANEDRTDLEVEIHKAHDLIVLNEESLNFSFEVLESTVEGVYEFSTLWLELKHNYDVGMSIMGTSFYR